MTRTTEPQKLFQRYLTGELPEQEREELEERIFLEDGALEEVRRAEDDLIDAFARGELAPGERERFLQGLGGSPRILRRVAVARGLAELADREAGERPAPAHTGSWWLSLLESLLRPRPALQGALAAAALIAVALGAGLFTESQRLRRQLTDLEPLAAENRDAQRRLREEEARSTALAEQIAGQQETVAALEEQVSALSARLSRSAVAKTVRFVLAPGMLRGAGEPSRLRIDPEADQVELQLEFDGDGDDGFKAVIHDARGDEVWSQSGLPARRHDWGTTVDLTVPARLLRGERYTVILLISADGRPFEILEEYPFTAAR